MYKVVLLRHGESEWNKTNLFTGWTDVNLTEKGIEEAKFAGKLLKENGFTFNLAYTSLLTRAIKTLHLALEEMGLLWIETIKNYRLNERHYGALQGLNKAETAAKYGDEQVTIWRRSYDTPPPALEKDDERSPAKDVRYANLSESEIPLTESLELTVARFVPYWENTIVPSILAGRKVIIVAHGNSLRALVKHLDNISKEEIIKLNIPTGIPLVYELDENLKPIKSYYLGDQEKIKAAINSVANQTKQK